MHEIPQWFEDKYPEKKLQAGHVLIRKNRIILSLSYRIPDSKQREGSIIGIDRGLYNHVAASDGMLVSSKHLHAVERSYAYTKSTLQSKGTRSAKKRLKAIAGREMRFRQDFDHCVSKSLSEREDVSCYVLEDLTGLREKRRKIQD